jgi:hypothetical protein
MSVNSTKIGLTGVLLLAVVYRLVDWTSCNQAYNQPTWMCSACALSIVFLFLSVRKQTEKSHTPSLRMWPECALSVLWALCFVFKHAQKHTKHHAQLQCECDLNVLWMWSGRDLNFVVLKRVQKHTSNHIQLRCACALNVLWILCFCFVGKSTPRTTHYFAVNVTWMCSECAVNVL